MTSFSCLQISPDMKPRLLIVFSFKTWHWHSISLVVLPYFTHLLGHLPFLLKDSYQPVKLPSSAFLAWKDSSLHPSLPCGLLFPGQYGKEAGLGGSKPWRDRRLRTCHTRPLSESSLWVMYFSSEWTDSVWRKKRLSCELASRDKPISHICKLVLYWTTHWSQP